MDRIVYRVLTVAVVALALFWVWDNFNSIAAEIRAFSADWWKY